MNHNGNKCKEGSLTVKPGSSPCCNYFEQRTRACQYEFRIEWSKKGKNWGVVLPDGSKIAVKFCPNCGKDLSGGFEVEEAECDQPGIRVSDQKRVSAGSCSFCPKQTKRVSVVQGESGGVIVRFCRDCLSALSQYGKSPRGKKKKR